MKLTTRLLTLGTLVLALGACSSGDLSKTDSGGVKLSITDFDQLPIYVSAAGDCCTVAVPSMTLANVALDPTGTTSELMNIEIQSYEVVYTREDSGSRVPPKLVQAIFGVVPVNGTDTLTNEGPRPFTVQQDQFNNQPFLDLKNYGRDLETGTTVVRMRLTLRFFGRTLAGKEVDSTPASFSIEVTP